MNTLEKYRFFGRLWCRVIHGHLMVKFAEDTDTQGRARTWWMCCRCLKCEILHQIK
jgi:hypothetical protein